MKINFLSVILIAIFIISSVGISEVASKPRPMMMIMMGGGGGGGGGEEKKKKEYPKYPEYHPPPYYPPPMYHPPMYCH